MNSPLLTWMAGRVAAPGSRKISAAAVMLLAGPVFAATPTLDPLVLDFTDRHCSSCHNDIDKEGGLDLTSLEYRPDDPANFLKWVQVHDRVQSGEMPPAEKKRPEADDMAAFLRGLSSTLVAHEREVTAREGRATQRRMNRSEYENTLRDLLSAPWLQVKDQLPEDGEAYRYNKVGDALEVSYVQMARYMGAARYAIREAMRAKLMRPPLTKKRYYAREQPNFVGGFNGHKGGNPFTDRHKTPIIGTEAQPEVRARRAPATVGESDPVTRELEAVGWIHGHYTTGFSSIWDGFRAPVSGRYRVRFSGYTIWVGPYGALNPFNNNDVVGHPPPARWMLPNWDDVRPGRQDEPITVSTKGEVINRRLGEFDLTTEPAVHDLGEVWLYEGDSIVVDASRFFRSRPTVTRGIWTSPLATRDGSPGVAFRWMEVEGPLPDPSAGAGYRLLFDNLPLKNLAAMPAPAAPTGRRGRSRVGPPPEPKYEVTSTNPDADAERLLRRFMARAFREPVEESKVQRYLGLYHDQRKAGESFTDAMITMYTGVLSSPSFIFIREEPGPLDDHALATRLALFLWNSEPDETLRARAARGELRRPEVLRAEAERLLNDPRAERFVNAFTDYWLDLRKIEETTPSVTLYNDYYLDEMLTDAAMAETRLFVTALIRDNLPARNIADSDFTYLNESLAQHYGISGVHGIRMRRVALPENSPRGGLITQASILKITANGTTTSPVLRGVWVTERIMGKPIPPPPASVPAVEPDTRGATTIREQLTKHSADESCAVCHRKLDPPGYALESFDVMGGWRDRYRAASTDVPPAFGFGRNGHPFMFHYALPVDPSGVMPDGGEFRNVQEFKQLLLKDERQLARNVARQLVVYATGAPVRFSDRAVVEQILDRARESEYGVRSIIHEVIQSDLFRNK